MRKYVQDLCLLKQIGRGYHSRVYYGFDDDNKKQCAIKAYPVGRIRQNPRLEENIFQQISILTRLSIIQDCENIIRFYQMMRTVNNYYIAFEYCNEGALSDLIRRKGKLQQKEALLFFKQMLQAFKILVKHKIFHKNLCPQKILIHNGIIKLSYFCFENRLQDEQLMRKCIIGIPQYEAPQSIFNNIRKIQHQNIWSLGVILFKMLFGVHPWKCNYNISLYLQMLKRDEISFPKDVTDFSPFLKNLIQRMTKYNPEQRISWQQLFQIKISNQGQIIQSSNQKSQNQQQNQKLSKNYDINPLKKQEQVHQTKSIVKQQKDFLKQNKQQKQKEKQMQKKQPDLNSNQTK